VLYVPDTHVALQAWGEPGDVDALTDGSVDVYSMADRFSRLIPVIFLAYHGYIPGWK